MQIINDINYKHVSFSFFGNFNARMTQSILPHVLCVDTGRSSETAKAHRG
eukprot:TRINITY_DN10139_c0_g1_i1.p2 TRINITY_DN10139_c0_g1~~TRINITY_DN10139_c0_g1_i1.p2  ORF type:complete len:50 (-),score=19.52 TRINITY_DN10139_c0_g1_i1:2-151(-)